MIIKYISFKENDKRAPLKLTVIIVMFLISGIAMIIRPEKTSYFAIRIMGALLLIDAGICAFELFMHLEKTKLKNKIMKLSFSVKLKDKPTHFVPKILLGIDKYFGTYDTAPFWDRYYLLCDKLGLELPPVNYDPKIHTLREKKKAKWTPGKMIHFVIFNRTKNYFQFAPMIPLVSTQLVDITYDYKICEKWGSYPTVFVDNRPLTEEEFEEFAINDGFYSVDEFTDYFSTDKLGLELRHWTNKRY